MVLHGIERAVRRAQKFFGRIAVFRESGDTGADGKWRVLGLSGEALADSRDHARRNVLARLRENQRKFVATVSRGSVDRPGMIAENLGNAHKRAAPGQMSVLIVDDLEAVHIEKHDTERAPRAARTVELRFKNADETAVIRQAGERIGDCHGAHLFEKPRLIQQRAGEHHDVDRKSTRLNSSHTVISYAVFCLKKKKPVRTTTS